MNLTQAEAISSLYRELLKSIPHDKLSLPTGYVSRKWEHSNIKEVLLDEDGNIQVRWSRYVGCGSYDEATTYEQLYDIFKDN